MEFKPCVVIPIYDHGKTVPALVQTITGYGIPIILVDDGSAAETKDFIRGLPAQYPTVQLFTFEHNQGKGAAVLHGFRQAFEQGFTHAVQFDADAQHAVSDIPKFLDMAAKHPEELIIGAPQYDSSVPKKRLYGRMITTFWVWIETLSFSVKDALLGFRVYPLKATIRLMDKVRIRPRMDFDVDILVRLYWEGVRVINIPTHVTYPEGGLSHFNLLRDNILISREHTRLVFGMLLRLPIILFHKVRSRNSHTGEWFTMQETGAYALIKLMLRIYLFAGRRFFQLLLHPVIFFYFVFNSSARKSSSKYLNRLYEHCLRNNIPMKKPTLFSVYCHLYTFGDMTLDKLSAWLGKLDASMVHLVDHQAVDTFVSDLKSGKGAVIIASHLGNIEALRAHAMLQVGITISGITYTRHAAQFNRLLREITPAEGLNLIQVGDISMQTAALLKEKIEHGEAIVVTGDRGVDDRDPIKVPFLGRPAPFPQGPFIIAGLMECPVYFLFGMKNKDRYDLYLEKISDSLRYERKHRAEQLKAVVARFAGRLEEYCARYPYQWFNFFDFWKE